MSEKIWVNASQEWGTTDTQTALTYSPKRRRKEDDPGDGRKILESGMGVNAQAMEWRRIGIIIEYFQ